MPIREQTRVACAELLVAWDKLLEKAKGLPPAERVAFIGAAQQIGFIQKIATLREVCEKPERAEELGVDLPKLLADASVNLVLMEESIDTSLRLGVGIRDSLLSTTKNEEDRLTKAEAERIRSANLQAVVPAVIGVTGGLFTTMIGILLERAVS